MKILVTGGTGFLGGHLIPQLVASGHDVFAFVRSSNDAPKMEAFGATAIIGNLQRLEEKPLPAIDAVVHAAAYFRFAGPRKPYFDANVGGTTAVLKAAKQAGVTTFVYISAAGVIMDDAGSPVRNADESAPTYPESFSGYVASKAQAESLVLAADQPGFRTIALRPAAIWGPGDAFAKQLPKSISSRQFAFFNRGDYLFATAHVDNVIEAIELALERGRGGHAYFIRDREVRTFREFIGMVADTHGVSIDRVRSIPYWLAAVIGRCMELFASLTRNKDDPPLSRSLVRMIGREFTLNDGAARHELGYVGKTTREAGQRRYLSG